MNADAQARGGASGPAGRGVLDVRAFVVPRRLIAFGHTFLRETGAEGYEGLVLWAGRRRDADPAICDIVDAFAPQQLGVRGPQGVGLSVNGDELFQINAELYRRRLRLVGQLHSHPTDAYHSSTDDAYATVTMPGGLSLVVPGFAVAPFALERTAVYRLGADGQWRRLTPTDAARTVLISDDEAGQDRASAGVGGGAGQHGGGSTAGGR